MGDDVPTLDQLLTEAPAADPAVVDGDRRISSATIERHAAALAGGLRARGVRRGDAVAWQLPNWHESIACYRACWRLGAVAAPLHHRAGRQEVASWIEALEPRVVLSAPDLPVTEITSSPITVRGDDARWSALLVADPVTECGAAVDDRAVVMFTSGSSSEPKGVVHTHRSLAYKAGLMAEVHGLGPDDVVLMPAPMAHVSGLLNGLLVPGVTGMKVVLVDRWDPGEALGVIERERVSFMVGPPTFFVGLMEHPGFRPDAVESLRVISCGGTGVTPAFVRHATERLGAEVKRSYGSTEAPTLTTSHAGDPPERAATTDGRAVGDVRFRVTDPRTGDELDEGATGELWVQGPEVFAGYLRADQTAEVMADGWFRTGDLVVIDDGWLTVVGRTKDVIIRAGENIAPAEVERVLEAHPQVRQAVAVGVPDDRLGEQVVAVVIAEGDFDLAACQAWFAAQDVARFKTPERVVQLVDLPLLASGKPDKQALVDQLASEPAR